VLLPVMKRGHIILISGAVIFIAGIVIAAIWGISFAGAFVRDNTIVGKTTINAGQSVSAKTEVNQLDNRPISLTVGIDKTGQQQQQTPPLSDVRLKETITDPNGAVVSSNEFGESFVTSFKPQLTGGYTVTVTNLGIRPVSIAGTFGYIPFIDYNGRPDINTMLGGGMGRGLGMIIVGGVMALAGVIILIVGGIVTVVDSRENRQKTPPTTSEGGITYRKD
jgi:hypothetical protein